MSARTKHYDWKPLATLGAGLRWLREQQGRTQGDVAEEAGIHSEMLTRYEKGPPEMQLLTLEKILKALDATPFQLIVAIRRGTDQEVLHEGLLAELGLGHLPAEVRERVLDLLRSLRDWQDNPPRRHAAAKPRRKRKKSTVRRRRKAADTSQQKANEGA